MKVFEWGENERLRKAFKWIEKEFQFEGYEKYKAQEESDSEVGDYPYDVIAFFEEVGFLVKKKFVDLDVIDDRLEPHIVSSWKKLELDYCFEKREVRRNFRGAFPNPLRKNPLYVKKR